MANDELLLPELIAQLNARGDGLSVAAADRLRQQQKALALMAEAQTRLEDQKAAADHARELAERQLAGLQAAFDRPPRGSLPQDPAPRPIGNVHPFRPPKKR